MKIVVLSSYRTGSTAFCNALAKMYKVKNYDEYFHRNKLQNNFDTIKEGSYVIKIMPDQIIEPQFSELIKSSTVYGIYRRNVIQQIASYFISIQRNVWHNQNNTDTEFYQIDYEDSQLRAVTNQMLTFNKDYEEKLRPLCIKEYIYEDIQTVLRLSDYKKYNRPSNYEELIAAIGTMVNNSYENI